MCVHDAGHECKYSQLNNCALCKYAYIDSKFFWFPNFLLIGVRFVGDRCILSVVDCISHEYYIKNFKVLKNVLLFLSLKKESKVLKQVDHKVIFKFYCKVFSSLNSDKIPFNISIFVFILWIENSHIHNVRLIP